MGKVENIVEKEKMLVTSIFFFSNNVFKIIPQSDNCILIYPYFWHHFFYLPLNWRNQKLAYQVQG